MSTIAANTRQCACIDKTDDGLRHINDENSLACTHAKCDHIHCKNCWDTGGLCKEELKSLLLKKHQMKQASKTGPVRSHK
jgi:hypothetical protein